MTNAVVLGRQRPGREIEPGVDQALTKLRAAGWEVESKVVRRKRELRAAAKAAVDAKVDIVVAVGGDGAVLQVVQAVGGSSVSLGIVPLGTGNLLATNLGIPKDIDAAIDVVLGGRPRTIDLGRVSGKGSGRKRLFAVACGVGFDAEVMQATTRPSKLRFGKLAYFASVVRKHDRVRNVRHTIQLDGVKRTMNATQVFVANFGGMGWAMEPTLEVQPDDGLLDVIIIRAGDPLAGLLAGWEAIRQKRHGRTKSGRVIRARARTVRISTTVPGRLVETDGSVVGKTPIKVSVVPGALTVLVPAE